MVSFAVIQPAKECHGVQISRESAEKSDREVKRFSSPYHRESFGGFTAAVSERAIDAMVLAAGLPQCGDVSYLLPYAVKT
jgi:hypothetical protein